MKSAIFVFLLIVCLSVNDASPNEDKDANHLRFGASPHLIGGDSTQLSMYSYSVRLRLSKDHKLVRFCGAAQIDHEWFLTAAECVDSKKYDLITVIMPHFESVTEKNVASFSDHRIHPSYDEKTKQHNIAIFRCIACKMTYVENLARLPNKKEISKMFINTKAIMAGWVNKDEAHRLDKPMRTLETTVIDNIHCYIAYSKQFDDRNHLCVGGIKGKGLSEEDVGIPLVIKEDGKDVKLPMYSIYDKNTKLIGIGTDIRPFDNTEEKPMVFTRVSRYIEWIHDVTGVFLY